MIKAITGTKDILPAEIPKWNYLESIVKSIAAAYNYKEIRTPVFEETGLFARGIGEATDIVSKEMYTFKDRSDISITLKPEMTAAVIRAFIEHSLGKQQGLHKLLYIAPMFRQERPQAGRYRQFHQFGFEAVGSHAPALDAEIIIMSYEILNKLGLKDLSVKINSLGVPASREEYKNILREYLSDKVKDMSEDSRKRFETNILRIFDSKIEVDQKIMENAPLLLEHLDNESLEHFEEVKQLLLAAKIPFEVDAKLVRGLDYYTNTTFEILSGSVGSQSALCGGGRYDLLAEQLGGDPTPGVGVAAGIERILLACENEGVLNLPDEEIDLYIVLLNKDLNKKANELAVQLRRSDLNIDLDYLSRSVKAQMREANKFNAKFVLLFGGDEYEKREAVLKDMSKGEQETISLDSLDSVINKIKGN